MADNKFPDDNFEGDRPAGAHGDEPDPRIPADGATPAHATAAPAARIIEGSAFTPLPPPPPPVPPHTIEVRRGGGFGAFLAFLALIAAGTSPWWGPLARAELDPALGLSSPGTPSGAAPLATPAPGADTAALDRLNQRLGTLERQTGETAKRVDTLSLMADSTPPAAAPAAAGSEAVADLQRRLEATEGRVNELETRAGRQAMPQPSGDGAIDPAQLQDLAERLTRLESQPQPAAAPTADLQPRLEALESEVAAVRETAQQAAAAAAQPRGRQTGRQTPPAEPQPAIDPKRIDELASRLATLEASLAEARAALAGRPEDAAPVLTAPAVDPAQLAQLSERLRKLEDETAARAASPGPAAPAADPRVDEQQGRLLALESELGRVRALAARVEEVKVEEGSRELLGQALRDMQSALDTLRTRVAGLEGRVETQGASVAGGPAAALPLAIGQLEIAAREGRPLAEPVQLVQRLAARAEDPALAQPLQALEAEAGQPVASIEALTERFRPLAGEIVRAEALEAGDMWGRMAYNMGALVSVRRTEGGTPTEQAVAAAEQALARRDVAGAVQALAPLQGPSATAAQPWLAEAQRRVRVDRALAQLQATAISRMGGTSTATPPPTAEPPAVPDEPQPEAPAPEAEAPAAPEAPQTEPGQ